MPIKDANQLSAEELQFYSRHLSLAELGVEGQQQLKAAKVLVVGAGGLGVPLLQYLTAAGIGTIGIIDHDNVEINNLHRQVLYDTTDVGKPKVEAAQKKLQDQNPFVNIRTYRRPLSSDNALDIMTDYDVIADGTDNFPARYLINDACFMLEKTLVQGSIFQFTGQISVFNMPDGQGGRGPNYRDLFPEPPPPGTVPSCAEAGVLGVLPGIIGSIQANEVIKVVTGIGQPLSGRLFLFDAKELSTRSLSVEKDAENPLRGDDPEITELIDYQKFCGVNLPTETDAENSIPQISPATYKAWLDKGEDVQLIDVREPFEAEIADIGGKLIPLNSLPEHLDEINRDKKTVIHCRSGKRSTQAVELLRQKGFEKVYNLEGGILAWSRNIDDSVPEY